MTPQLKVVSIGAVAGLVAKFGFQQSNQLALIYALGAIAVWSVLTTND
jgi:hypothetical protein